MVRLPFCKGDATMDIRQARIDDDFQAVAQLYLTVWRATYQGILPASFLAQLTPATWHPERRWQATWLALADDQIVGTCAAGAARDANRTGWGEVYSIYVAPDQQHQGLGQQLMAAALTKLSATYSQVYLEVLTDNCAARQFYQQLGFTQKGPAQTRTVPQGQISIVEMVRSLAD